MVRICMLTLFLLAMQFHWSYTHGSSDTIRKVNALNNLYELLSSILYEFYNFHSLQIMEFIR